MYNNYNQSLIYCAILAKYHLEYLGIVDGGFKVQIDGQRSESIIKNKLLVDNNEAYVMVKV